MIYQPRLNSDDASQLLAERPAITTAHGFLQVNNKKPIRHCRPLHDRGYRLSLVSFLLRKLAGSAGWASPAWEVIIAQTPKPTFKTNFATRPNATLPRYPISSCGRFLAYRHGDVCDDLLLGQRCCLVAGEHMVCMRAVDPATTCRVDVCTCIEDLQARLSW